MFLRKRNKICYHIRFRVTYLFTSLKAFFRYKSVDLEFTNKTSRNKIQFYFNLYKLSINRGRKLDFFTGPLGNLAL